MSSNTIAGTIHFKANGTPYSAFGNWSIDPGFSEKESLINGAGKRDGVKESFRPPSFTGDMRLPRGVALSDIANIRDATLTIEVGSGTRHVLAGANAAGQFVFETEEGKVACKFDGDKYTENVG